MEGSRYRSVSHRTAFAVPFLFNTIARKAYGGQEELDDRILRFYGILRGGQRIGLVKRQISVVHFQAHAAERGRVDSSAVSSPDASGVP